MRRLRRIMTVLLGTMLALSAMNVSIFAAETDIIVTADKMTFTVNGNTPDKVTNLSAAGWGDGTHVPCSIDYRNGEQPKASYSELPQGMYRVFYYLTKNHEGNDKGRSARILDTDVHITDKNGTTDIVSVKDYIYDSGYKELGVFEFDETNKSIEITLNEDNMVVKGQMSPMFAVSHIKLEPVTEEHSDLLQAVNAAGGGSEMRMAVEANGEDFVDSGALFRMDGVYEELYESRPLDGYTSSYHFKREFERCVEETMTKMTIQASSFVWQTSKTAAESNGWRINWSPVELQHRENSNVAVATFRFTNTDGIKKIALKLNHDKDSNTVANNVVITQYSGDIYENASDAKIQDRGMNNVNFAELNEPKRLMLSEKDLTESDLLDAINRNGYLSLYMRGDTISYPDANCGQLKLSADCSLTVYYDLTYLGGKADLKYYSSDETELDSSIMPVKNECIRVKQADGKNFVDFDFLNYITVSANDEDLPKTDYTVTKIDDATIEIKLKDAFSYDTKYIVKSDKYVSFIGDDLSYEFCAELTTEKYPAEFGGVKLTTGGHTITSLDGLKGETVNFEAKINNNSLPVFGAYMLVNLYEQLENGIKMIDSKVIYGNVEKNNSLTLADKFDIPDRDGDWFVTAHILDGFNTMNYIKMYNTDSYQRID